MGAHQEQRCKRTPISDGPDKGYWSLSEQAYDGRLQACSFYSHLLYVTECDNSLTTIDPHPRYNLISLSLSFKHSLPFPEAADARYPPPQLPHSHDGAKILVRFASDATYNLDT